MSVQSIVEWIMDQNTCFLMGAGCSLCAGKPNIDCLTDAVRENLSQPGQDLLSNLKGTVGRSANIEDLINYLLRMRQLSDSRITPLENELWSTKNIEAELSGIQKQVVQSVGKDWTPSLQHQRFLTRLASSPARKPIDIFSLNYDTVLEASLESLKFWYTDGFMGSENAYFEPRLFEKPSDLFPIFRIYKLHGSVNWVRDDDETVRRRHGGSLGDTPRTVIYPAEQKYIQTQYGIYEVIMRCFRDRLRESDKNNKLVVIGYSFRDEHINMAIEDSIRTAGSNLTVYAFVGPEKDTNAQKNRFETMAINCDHRLNIIGDQFHVGPALDGADLEEIAKMELWRFENLVALLTGASNE